MLLDLLADEYFANPVVPHVPCVYSLPCVGDLSLRLRLHRLGQVNIEAKKKADRHVLLDFVEEWLCFDFVLLLGKEGHELYVLQLVNEARHFMRSGCFQSHNFMNVLDHDKKVQLKDVKYPEQPKDLLRSLDVRELLDI